jgi:ketosteroid isomerase-like protein
LALTGVGLSDSTASEHPFPQLPAGEPRLLTQPYLQNPTEHAVTVAWLTNFEGQRHTLTVARGGGKHGHGAHQRVVTTRLERLFEDRGSKLEQDIDLVSQRVVYRHEAVVERFGQHTKQSYWVESTTADGKKLRAGPYTLRFAPAKGRPLQILLTSDQQERFNTLATYQKVEELFPDLDAIFFAGDLANHPRRGSEWFDNYRSSWHANPWSASPAFFPAMQGTFHDFVPESPYRGGALLQNVPLFPAIANHEVSGRFRPNETYMVNGAMQTATINSMFNDPQPRWFAEYRYRQVAPWVSPGKSRKVREQWIRDNSNDFEVYRDLFTLPDEAPEGESYYAKKLGDVFLISLNVSRIWRTWDVRPQDRSKFIELLAESNNPEEWGFGEHIFTPFAEGSKQHRWLKKTLSSRDFKESKYRVVMFHQSAFGLGDNTLPVLTDPVMHVQYTNEAGISETKRVLMPQDDKLRAETFKVQVEPLLGRIEEVRYEYPLEADYFHRDIEPLLHRHGVQLVLVGHSHIWNRSRTAGLNFLETSNAGNCFGAYWTQPDGARWLGGSRSAGSSSFWNEVDQGAGASRWNPLNYPRTDDPHGRKPILPTLAHPMVLFEGAPEPVPFVCSNNVTTFSVLDTKQGVVRSFAFDVRDPGNEVIEFDRFSLGEPRARPRK